ncbi:MAG: hypothetical protein IPO83_08110 [Chitinophagaceae bacterium]|nr:hypothetical protein [Chitinophagaceae bacterium]
MANRYPTFLLTEFEKFLRNILSDIYDSSELKFEASGNFYSIAHSQFALRYNNAEWIVPFFIKKFEQQTDKRWIYWIGVTMKFSSTKEAEPHDVSLRFFLGEREDQITMIFRAEYSLKVQNHGQPHWHFHLIDEIEKTPDTYEAFTATTTESFEVKPELSFSSKFKDIHFSMAWRIKEGQFLDLSGNTMKWMQETLKYLKKEIQEVHS